MSGRSVSIAVFALVSLLAVPVSSADAQLAELIPGVRTRIRAPGTISGRVTGTVLTRTADSLSLATEHGVPLQLSLSRLTAVEISRGRSRASGALKGALWGGGIGLLSGLFSDSGDENCTLDCVSRGEMTAAAGAGGAILGAAIGAAVGSERWDRLELPVRTALIRTHGGPAAVLSIGF